MATPYKKEKNVHIQAQLLTVPKAFPTPPLSEICEICPSELEPCHPPWERRSGANLLMAIHVNSQGVILHTHLSLIPDPIHLPLRSVVLPNYASTLPAVTHSTTPTPSPASSTVSGLCRCSIKVCWTIEVQEDFFSPQKQN